MNQEDRPGDHIEVSGSGAAATHGGVAAGEGGMAVGGDVVYGDKVGGDKVARDKVEVSTHVRDVHGGTVITAGRDVSIGQRITNFFLGSTEQQRAQRNRRKMLQLVGNTWVKGVLEQSLHGEIIKLGLVTRADAVDNRPWDIVLQMPDQPNRPLPPGTNIVDVFDKMNQALLILGEPGSGKTTMLLELARNTIARAEQDATQPIPVVFNLSSWSGKKQPIAEWLVEELSAKYNIPKKIAREWVEDDALLLLLDGLDEVAQEHREDCVRAINDLCQEHMMPLVVCSRIADYEALTTRFRLQGAVFLQGLTSQQVDEYLDKAGAELVAVREALQDDATLQELVETPLMLSIMSLAYRGMSVGDLRKLDSLEARRRHVFAAYVRGMFERRKAEQLYSPEQTIHWLAWLAQKLSAHRQTIFLIEGLQPDWLPARTRRQVRIVARLVFGLVGGLFFGLVGGLVLGLGDRLGLGLVFGLVLGLGGGLVLGLGDRLGLGLVVVSVVGRVGRLDLVEPVETLKWSWRRATIGLGGGLVLGLVVGLVLGLVVELVVGLFDVLFFGLLGGLVFGLASGLENVEIETKMVPNQGIRQSARNALIIGLVVGLAFGLVGGLAGGLVTGLAFGLVTGLAFGLAYGGGAVILHFALRYVLCRHGYLPWSLVRFLDYAAERIFLRKVGGGYIFIHRLLQDYFAALDQGQ